MDNSKTGDVKARVNDMVRMKRHPGGAHEAFVVSLVGVLGYSKERAQGKEYTIGGVFLFLAFLLCLGHKA